MYPEILRIGPFILRSYGLFIAIGIIVGFFAIINRAKKLKLSEDDVLDLILYLIIGGVIGAKIMYILTNNFLFFVNNPMEILRTGGQGLSFIGMVIAGILLTYWFAKRRKINYWGLLDVLAIGTTLGYAFGRIGCFLNGCCYGLPTNSWIGFRFSVTDFPRYPTQLFISLSAFISYFILLRIDNYKKFYGKTFSWALILYSISTFIIEFYRDNPKYPPFGITLNQYSALIIIPVCIILLVRLTSREQIREVEGLSDFKYGNIIDQKSFDEDLNVVDIE